MLTRNERMYINKNMKARTYVYKQEYESTYVCLLGKRKNMKACTYVYKQEYESMHVYKRMLTRIAHDKNMQAITNVCHINKDMKRIRTDMKDIEQCYIAASRVYKQEYESMVCI